MRAGQGHKLDWPRVRAIRRAVRRGMAVKVAGRKWAISPTMVRYIRDGVVWRE